MSENNQNETSTIGCLVNLGRGKTCGLPSVCNGFCKEHYSLVKQQQERKQQEEDRKKFEEDQKKKQIALEKNKCDSEYLKIKEEFEKLIGSKIKNY
jgi:hypothetical protein